MSVSSMSKVLEDLSRKSKKNEWRRRESRGRDGRKNGGLTDSGTGLVPRKEMGWV